MALHIRDNRAASLARQLAARKGVTMTQAVVTALEGALAQETRPLADRIADIARDASRLGRGKRRRTVKKREIDELWGNS
jgi:antitoxin VapB